VNRRVALVTGGTRGIGYGVARALVADGCDVVLCGRRAEPEVAEALAELRATGREAAYVRADVADPAGRASLVAAAMDAFGRIDVLVNNAGVAPTERRDLLSATEESFDRVVGTNLKGPYFLTQAVANQMVAARAAQPETRPVIVFVTSISSTVVSTNRGEYCVSKAGLSMAAALFAVRLAEFDIPVYEVRPGVVRTDMTSAVSAKYDTLIADGLIPQARWGQPEDVGRAVAMLARGDLGYSTGQVIMVDGGMTLGRL
jgi:3-oxoacyl-[acyl-carrier protein] reductase